MGHRTYGDCAAFCRDTTAWHIGNTSYSNVSLNTYMAYCRCLLRDNTSRRSSALLMETAGSSEKSEHYRGTTRRHIQRQRSFRRSFTLSGVNRQQANRLNVVTVRFRRTRPVKLKILVYCKIIWRNTLATVGRHLLKAESPLCTAHSTHDILGHAATPPHNKLQRNFTKCFNINITLARLNCKFPDDGRRPKHVGAV